MDTSSQLKTLCSQLYTLELARDGACVHVYRTPDSTITQEEILECLPSAQVLPFERAASLSDALCRALLGGLLRCGDQEMVVGLAHDKSLRCSACMPPCRWMSAKDVREFRRDATVLWASGSRADGAPCGEVLLKAPQFNSIVESLLGAEIDGDLSTLVCLARDAGHQVSW